MGLRKPPFKNKICTFPFEYLDIQNYREGSMNCYACCPTTLPKPVGDLKKNTIDEIWRSDDFNSIRESILDGNYQYCVSELCPVIQTDNLIDKNSFKVKDIKKIEKMGLSKMKTRPKIINLSYDRTCNLACPSCRSDFIFSNDNEEEIINAKITDELLSSDLSHTTLIVCSSGDPFYSKHFKKLLFTIDGSKHRGLKIQIMTNGILLNRKNWEAMAKIHKNISGIYISIDAASESTYKIVRRGGDWNLLMRNCEFLSMLKTRGEIDFLRLDFVVQDHNYKEMVEFVKLGEKLKVDEVFFQKVVNWGYFTESEFKQREIYNVNHPDHREFLNHISSPELNKKIVNHGNLGHLFSFNKKTNYFNVKNAIICTFKNLKKRYLS